MNEDEIKQAQERMRAAHARGVPFDPNLSPGHVWAGSTKKNEPTAKPKTKRHLGLWFLLIVWLGLLFSGFLWPFLGVTALIILLYREEWLNSWK